MRLAPTTPAFPTLAGSLDLGAHLADYSPEFGQGAGVRSTLPDTLSWRGWETEY